MNKYRIYPSLLDGYAYMNEAESGDEYTKREQELLDSINRVEREPSYYMARGTALNELVDAAACHVSIPSEREYQHIDLGDNGGYHKIYCDGFELAYDDGLVARLAEQVRGMSSQVYCEATLATPMGIVLLYGYCDYVGLDMVVDLKTAKAFEACKYSEHWQRRVYPYCLEHGGLMQDVRRFDYLCAVLSAGKDGLLNGEIYTDTYEVNVDRCQQDLFEMLSYQFLPWLERHRRQITDKKIFGYE